MTADQMAEVERLAADLAAAQAECEALRQRIAAVEALIAERETHDRWRQNFDGSWASRPVVGIDEVRAALAAEPSGPREPIQWQGGTSMIAEGNTFTEWIDMSVQWYAEGDAPLTERCGREIVAWINAHGGEAQYVRLGEDTPDGWSGYPRIAIRSKDVWVYARPGDTVQMTGAGFAVEQDAGFRAVRAFRVVSEPSGPEPTTSDEPAAVVTFDGEPIEALIPSEPARCEHGKTEAHLIVPDDFLGIGAVSATCPGPAASGTPDGGR